MKTQKIVFLLLAALPLFSLTLNAEARDGQRRFGRSGNPLMMMRELNLTMDQKAKLAQIRKGDLEKMQGLRNKMQTFHNKMKEALQSDASSDELRKIHKEARSLREEMDDQRFEQLLKIREILTPEQKKKFAEHMQRHPGGPMGKEGVE